MLSSVADSLYVLEECKYYTVVRVFFLSLLKRDDVCLISVRQRHHDESFDTCWCKFKLLEAFQQPFPVSEV